ncbi:MAG: voltage-gated potassium channel, partial [Myxococcota bacterium]
VSPMALIDLVAVAPFYLQFIEMDTRIARAIRMFRLVRILKMGRYAKAVNTLSEVVMRKKEELAIVMFVLVLLLILCSSAIYFVEGDPNKIGFSSIPEAMWWSIVTITSVGYGDVSPSTDLGKFVGGIICLVGVLFVALPTGILSAGFLETMREKKVGSDSEIFGFCPHCGEQLLPGEELE